MKTIHVKRGPCIIDGGIWHSWFFTDEPKCSVLPTLDKYQEQKEALQQCVQYVNEHSEFDQIVVHGLSGVVVDRLPVVKG